MKPRVPLLFAYTIATIAATWLLLVIGGTVNPTGSSLACPDWYFVPTCYGEVFPADWSGGILFEHGHRMWASLVGLLTVGLAVWLSRHPIADRRTRQLGWGAVVMVAVQGTLGGLTVKLGLSWWVSTLHLVIAMVFFCLLITLAARVRSASAEPTTGRPAAVPRRLIGVAILLVVAQIALGGLVRHKGAGLICGDDWLACGRDGFWPYFDLARLHMSHRFAGYAVTLLVFACSFGVWRAARDAGRARLARLAWLPTVAVVAQVVLGLVTVATVRNVTIVALHTAVAGVVLASLVVVYLTAGPLFSAEPADELELLPVGAAAGAGA